MYGTFAYNWNKLMVNLGKYSIHGSYGMIFLYCCLFVVSPLDRFALFGAIKHFGWSAQRYAR